MIQVAPINKQTMPIQIKILHPKIGTTIPLPEYTTTGSAGLDLRVCIDAPIQIISGSTVLLPTGLALYIANPELTAIILPRSGLGHNYGIVLGNLVGLIDSDYQGEIKISCWNRSTTDFTVLPGDRLAQLVFVPIVQVQLTIVQEFITTDRHTAGFGSSGLA